jgi:hypothetical protein
MFGVIGKATISEGDTIIVEYPEKMDNAKNFTAALRSIVKDRYGIDVHTLLVEDGAHIVGIIGKEGKTL